jgi:hypothetical protein
VKRSPTPTVIGCPGPSVIGINPMAITIIRAETGLSRNPYITISAIIYPIAIRAEIIVELLISNLRLLLRICLIIFIRIALVISRTTAGRNSYQYQK